MSNICTHVKDDGSRCESPAMYRRELCYYHWRQDMLRRTAVENEHFLPTLDSDAGVQLAAAQVFRALASGQMQTFRAQTLLASLKLVASCLRMMKKSPAKPEDLVTELTPAMAAYLGVQQTPPADTSSIAEDLS